MEAEIATPVILWSLYQIALSKKKLKTPDVKWVAQVSLLRPGCSGQGPFPKGNPGLKSETWATHLIFVRSIFIFVGCRSPIDTLANTSLLERVGYHPLRAAFTGLGALVVKDSQQMIAAL